MIGRFVSMASSPFTNRLSIWSLSALWSGFGPYRSELGNVLCVVCDSGPDVKYVLCAVLTLSSVTGGELCLSTLSYGKPKLSLCLSTPSYGKPKLSPAEDFDASTVSFVSISVIR